MDRLVLSVELGARAYPIHVGRGLLDDRTLIAGLAPGRHVLLVSDANVAPHYLARVQVPDTELPKLEGQTLLPGMPAEVIIKTGERSLLTYLAAPLLKRMAGSLKEE